MPTYLRVPGKLRHDAQDVFHHPRRSKCLSFEQFVILTSEQGPCGERQSLGPRKDDVSQLGVWNYPTCSYFWAKKRANRYEYLPRHSPYPHASPRSAVFARRASLVLSPRLKGLAENSVSSSQELGRHLRHGRWIRYLRRVTFSRACIEIGCDGADDMEIADGYWIETPLWRGRATRVAPNRGRGKHQHLRRMEPQGG